MSTTIEPFYKDLGGRVQKAREKRGLSQAQLGAMLQPKMTRASIANIENAKQRVLVHRLVELSFALDVSLEDLTPRERPQKTVKPSPNLELELARKLGVSSEEARTILEKAL